MPDQIIPAEAEFTLLKKQLMGIKRRTSVRYRSALANLGRLFFPHTGQEIEVWICNLSDGGVGLSLNGPLEAETALIIHLKGPAQNVSLKLAARVVHSTREVDGTWRIGCEFDRKLSADELDALL